MNGTFKATDETELWVVRQDGLKRGFRFKDRSRIQIGMMMVIFAHQDIIEEIAIDDD